MIGINAGSGQRAFDTARGWINLDINPRWDAILADWNNLSMFADNTVDYVVSVHSIEHAGCGEADGFIKESFRVLKPGGSLIVLVPDMKALAERWLAGELTDQIYMTNVYGAYMGDEADRHKWGWSRTGLWQYLKRLENWHDVHAFNNRPIPGADIPSDWWMVSLEAIK